MRNIFFLFCLITNSVWGADGFDVPFDFHSAGQVLPAGRYQLNAVPQTGSVYRLANHATRKSILVSFPQGLTSRAGRAGWMVFQCAQSPCKLAGVVSLHGLDAVQHKSQIVLVSAGQ